MDREQIRQRRIGLVQMIRTLGFHRWLYQHGYYRDDNPYSILRPNQRNYQCLGVESDQEQGARAR